MFLKDTRCHMDIWCMSNCMLNWGVVSGGSVYGRKPW